MKRRLLVLFLLMLISIPSGLFLWTYDHPYIINIKVEGKVFYSLWTVDDKGKLVVLLKGEGSRVVVSLSLLKRAETYSKLRNSSYPLLGVDVWIASNGKYYALPPTTFLLVSKPSPFHSVELTVKPNLSLAREVPSLENTWKTTYFKLLTLRVPYLVLFKNSTGNLFLDVRYVGYSSYLGPRITVVWDNMSLVRVLDTPLAEKYYTGVSLEATNKTSIFVAGLNMKVAVLVQEDYSFGRPTSLKRYLLVPVRIKGSGPKPVTLTRWEKKYSKVPPNLIPKNVSYLPPNGYGVLGGGTVTLLQIYSDVWEGNQSTYALGVGLPVGLEVRKEVPLPDWFDEVPLMFGNSFAGVFRLRSTVRIFGAVTPYELQLKQSPMEDKYSNSRIPFGLYLLVRGTSLGPGGTSR